MHALRIINKDGQAPTAEEITAANKVATTFKSATIGTFKVTDPIDDIEVEYHAHKALAFTQGGSSIYFGFDAAVEMRCRCRALLIPNTAIPYAKFTISDNYLEGYQFGVEFNPSQSVEFNPFQIPFYHNSSSLSIRIENDSRAYLTAATRLGILTSTAEGPFSGEYTVTLTPGESYVIRRNGKVVLNVPIFEVYDKIASKPSAETYYLWSNGGDNLWISNVEVFLNPDNYKSSIYLSDGSELDSVKVETELINSYYDDAKYATVHNATFNDWVGGGKIPLFTNHIYFTNHFGGLAEVYDGPVGYLNFDVPDDACFSKVDKETYLLPPGLGEEGISELYDLLDEHQVQGLVREHARRKKCSDGQLAYLRNGFLSPEFEYFIKTQHPISTLVRRDIPMQVVSRDQELVSDVTDDNDNRTRVWSASVTVKYNFVDDDGNVDPKEHTFTGTIQQVDTTHKARNDEPIAEVSSSKFTYTNFPMLADSSTGEAYTLPSPLPALPYSASLTLKTNNAIWHDDKSYPLLVEANGTFNKSPWVEDDTYSYPSYPYDSTTLVPPVEKTSDYITFAHPQFLLDYIRDSKPVEKTTDSNGNKAPVTPSTDWLSSRLAHDEVVTIIPLSFVNADGEDRGMYPYIHTDDEVPAHVKIVGYARFKYNYFTASFSFVSFTEFTTESDIKHDGNATYDDETNPTSVTVGETTYALQPKYFDYDPEYGSTNCVCIGNKAIWTDVKADAKEQKKNIADTAPEGHELTAEEKLYKAVREAIA